MSDILQSELLEFGILHLRLNRPQQLNALNFELLTTLSDQLIDAGQRDDVRAVLLTGEGKGFCAGADIKQLAALDGSSGTRFAQFGQQVLSQLDQLGKPSLAAIHGFALGGGCELAMATTLRIATENTVFGQPEIKLGVIPGFGGTQRLTHLIGKGRALEICLTGRRFSVEEAHQWGLVSEICPSDQLLTRAKTILHTITQFSPVAIKSVLNTISQAQTLPLSSGLMLEAAEFGVCCSSEDKNEGVTAFLEKRSPKFGVAM